MCFILHVPYAWVLMLLHVVYQEESLFRSRHMVSTGSDMTCDAYVGVCNDLLLRMYLPCMSFVRLSLFFLE